MTACCTWAYYGRGERCAACTERGDAVRAEFAREFASRNTEFNTNTVALPAQHPLGNRAQRRKLQAIHRRDMRRNERSSR